MTTKNDGEPAFPFKDIYQGVHGHHQGMSLRDYFAAHAPEIPSYMVVADSEEEYPESIARWNYIYADAMIKERQK
jgi:hypothetical protein